MNLLSCPRCGKSIASRWSILWTGPFRTMSCGNCGAKIGLRKIDYFLWTFFALLFYWLGVSILILLVDSISGHKSFGMILASFAGGLVFCLPVIISYLKFARLEERQVTREG